MASSEEFPRRIFAALNAMLLDMLAAISRKDKDNVDRGRRQAQGQAV
jgi:hypothetical protein